MVVEEVVRQQPLPLGDWDDIIGHDQERCRLVQAGDFPSLLFSGPPGLGKRLLAIWLAAHRNCQNPPAQSPWACDCKSCRLILKNQHPDIYWVERAPGKLSLGVAEARELIHQLYLRPYQAKTRVCIVSEAERLTEEAQSALLKTLEEPPDHNLLILVTSQESKLLPTVQSRCRIHRFRPLEDTMVEAWLRQQGCQEAEILLYSSLAQGCPGKARQFLENPALWQARESLLDLLEQVPQSSLGVCLELAGKCESLKVPGQEGRAQIEWVLDCAQVYYRDIMLLQAGVENLVHRHRKAQLERLQDQSQSMTRWLGAIQEARDYHTANVNSRLLMQDLFLKLRR